MSYVELKKKIISNSLAKTASASIDKMRAGIAKTVLMVFCSCARFAGLATGGGTKWSDLRTLTTNFTR